MSAFFITSTGTDIGKTLVTCGLAWQLRQAGKDVRTVKPVISGFDPEDWSETDTANLLRASGHELTMTEAEAISPWRYKKMVSPHLAAEEASAEPSDILHFCRDSITSGVVTLIEGAGGVMTPLTWGYNQAELLEELSIPCVLVVGSYVGTISHTLTALEALRSRGVKVASVIISESVGSLTSIRETAETLCTYTKIPIFELPRIPVGNEMWKNLPPLTDALYD